MLTVYFLLMPQLKISIVKQIAETEVENAEIEDSDIEDSDIDKKWMWHSNQTQAGMKKKK